MQKPSIPKGMRDFGPEEMVRRNYIFDTISQVYELFGYHHIETPSMEMLSTLMGKYGEEGDRLLFKVLNSGDVLSSVNKTELEHVSSSKFAAMICEKGLRYDLTVPFARYVVTHRNEITFPFRRYQIQPVWRADKPQKGRYREFYQCDADVIGSDSLLNEVELIGIIDEVFRRLRIPISILLNNRKILAGIAEVIGEADRIIEFTVAIDKIDKIGMAGVRSELSLKGFGGEVIDRIEPLITCAGSNREKLEEMRTLLADSETGLKGIEEITYILDRIEALELGCTLKVDISLARGLSYYTGAILEVKAVGVQIGSISGGGRYDNLTGIFGLDGMSGVGISFGADRIYDVMNELGLFPDECIRASEVLFINFADEYAEILLPLITQLRRAGINTEYYPDTAKLKKQMGYANNHKIPYVALVGEDEMRGEYVTMKDMNAGTQERVPFVQLIDYMCATK